jgi:hypothetical protein
VMPLSLNKSFSKMLPWVTLESEESRCGQG